MTAKAETAITTACIDYIKRNTGDAWHVHGGMFQRSGEPDICGEIILADHPVHLKIEVKTMAKASKPSKLQIHRLLKYHRYGYGAAIVRSVEELQETLMMWHSDVEDKLAFYRWNAITYEWIFKYG